jgi:hypothetical protein
VVPARLECMLKVRGGALAFGGNKQNPYFRDGAWRRINGLLKPNMGLGTR